MPIRDEIVESAREWIGTKWLHQGRTAKGLDCAGLIIQVGLKHGLLKDGCDPGTYSKRSTSIEIASIFAAHLNQKKLVDVEPGDVLIFRHTVYPHHSAFVGSNNQGLTLIHAAVLRRSVVEEQYTDEWKRKATHCFEFHWGE